MEHRGKQLLEATQWSNKSAGFPISGDRQVFLPGATRPSDWMRTHVDHHLPMLELLGNALVLHRNRVFGPSHGIGIELSHQQQGLKSSEPLYLLPQSETKKGDSGCHIALPTCPYLFIYPSIYGVPPTPNIDMITAKRTDTILIGLNLTIQQGRSSSNKYINNGQLGLVSSRSSKCCTSVYYQESTSPASPSLGRRRKLP